ncbi:GAF and ANTAR domain-containing protein [Kribbella jejuensis]|uniref:GAF domain-containing protein n=1 Tax=Kribbella jejuensis TaxID=236068 RepID=A0A542EP07_9ACTN|nr:GAF and ANTAR domain-containing protein [Kribbella jejuensis]TQJ16946.1 GAF domain-containing protein [Kribbella jejuensis]
MFLTQPVDHQLSKSSHHRSAGSRPTGLVAAAFGELAVELYSAATMAETVDLVLDCALRLPGCDCAGLILMQRGNHLQTAGVTDLRVEHADQLQLEYGEGPCVPVGSEHYDVLVGDTVSDPRWPRWSPAVAELGLRNVLTVRLFTTRSPLGALNLYQAHPGQFTAADEVIASVLARHASVAVDTVQRTSMLAQVAEASSTIGQAQGRLMERYAIDADQAFAVLRRCSQDNNKLRVVVDELVSTRRPPTRIAAVSVRAG